MEILKILFDNLLIHTIFVLMGIGLIVWKIINPEKDFTFALELYVLYVVVNIVYLVIKIREERLLNK